MENKNQEFQDWYVGSDGLSKEPKEYLINLKHGCRIPFYLFGDVDMHFKDFYRGEGTAIKFFGEHPSDEVENEIMYEAYKFAESLSYHREYMWLLEQV